MVVMHTHNEPQRNVLSYKAPEAIIISTGVLKFGMIN